MGWRAEFPRRDVEQLNTVLCERGQQVDYVEIFEQAVDERDDGVQYPGFTRVSVTVPFFLDLQNSPSAHQSASRFNRRSRMSPATSVTLRPEA